LEDLLSNLGFFIPLGIVGVLRWGSWMFRRLVGIAYKPVSGSYKGTVSVITPVYKEDPVLLRKALESWKANRPHEIIAVIDSSDDRSIGVFKDFARTYSAARLIITDKPGKRPALADGARASTGDIIAFVDSDTVWTDDTLAAALPPFADPRVGGVATRQNVLEPNTLSQNIFDIQLDLRFHDDMMPSGAAGTAFTCLSGRTALYRREAVLPLLDAMVHETFWGKQCIGGDDKRLTYLVEAAGWKARYQHNSRVYTPGAPALSTFMRQRTRWSRNSWRADLRALKEGWVFKHKFLAYLLIERSISNFTLLISPAYFVVSLILGLWVPALILAAWWLVSRGVRLMPNLLRRPSNIRLIPVYIGINFALGVVRIYALLTLNRQDWLTRGAPRKKESLGLVLARVGTAAIVFGIGAAVWAYRF
jgi:hyaluronan synthase